MEYTKKGVAPQEYEMQRAAYSVAESAVPHVHVYDPVEQTLTMDRVEGMSVADMYGECFEDMPAGIVEEIRKILRALWNAWIEYPDITGYNFIESAEDGHIYVIDFEHARFNYKRETYDPHMAAFIEGEVGWNPRFL